MIEIKKSGLGLLLIVGYGNIFSQNTVELLSVSQQLSAPAAYDSVYTKNANERAFKIELTIPIVMSEKNIWYTNIIYDKFYVGSGNTMPNDVANPINLQGISLRSGLIHNINKKNALYMFLSPRMQGDFEKINANTFQPGAVFLFENKFRNDFIMRFGVAYYQDYISPFVVPLVYIYRQFNNKLKIVGSLPQDFRIHYKKSEKFAFGGQYYANSSVYHLGYNNYFNDYILKRAINLSLYTRFQLLGPLYTEFGGGYTYDREYMQYAESDKFTIRFPVVEVGGKNRTAKTVHFKDGLFFNVRLVIDFPIPD